MRRLTLAGQIAVLVTLAVFVAQAISLALAIETRRTMVLGDAIGPAAHRLALAAAAPTGVATGPAPGVIGTGKTNLHKPRLSSRSPVTSDARRERDAEALLDRAFDQQQVRVPELRAVSLPRSGQGEAVVLLAARLADGRWISLQAPRPEPVGPLVTWMALQSLAIALAILIPTLLLVRRVGGSLTALAQSASIFDGTANVEPVRSAGPRDVRRLIDSTNGMMQRIVALNRERDIFLGAVGHDLRTPLTALRIEAETVPDSDQRGALIEQIEVLQDELDEILTFARAGLGSERSERFDLGRLAVECCETARQPSATLGTVNPVLVQGDRRAIRRAIANLLDNALRYSGSAEISVNSSGRQAILSVADRGPGIPPGDRADAVAPFRRLEPSRNRSTGGSGLGLAIVEAIALAHSGKLDLADRDGGGLVASIVLPQA